MSSRVGALRGRRSDGSAAHPPHVQEEEEEEEEEEEDGWGQAATCHCRSASEENTGFLQILSGSSRRRAICLKRAFDCRTTPFRKTFLVALRFPGSRPASAPDPRGS